MLGISGSNSWRRWLSGSMPQAWNYDQVGVQSDLNSIVGIYSYSIGEVWKIKTIDSVACQCPCNKAHALVMLGMAAIHAYASPTESPRQPTCAYLVRHNGFEIMRRAWEKNCVCNSCKSCDSQGDPCHCTSFDDRPERAFGTCPREWQDGLAQG